MSPHSSAGRPSRRAFLVAGGVAAAAGVAGGVLAGFQISDGTGSTPEPSAADVDLHAALRAAADVEKSLIASLDASTGGGAAVQDLVAQVRADHNAHLEALRALIAKLPAVPAQASSASPAPAVPRTLAELRSAEELASANAAAGAARLFGAHAALLASIAACEAGHGEMLA